MIAPVVVVRPGEGVSAGDSVYFRARGTLYRVDRAALTETSDPVLVQVRAELAREEERVAAQAQARREAYLAQGAWVVVYPATPGATPTQGWQGRERAAAEAVAERVAARRPDLRGQDVRVMPASRWYDLDGAS